MGVQVKRDNEEDKEIFDKAIEEANLIIDASKPIITLNSEKINEDKELEIILNATDQKLCKRLKSFRFIAAQRECLPAYAVFHDTDLKKIASQRPKTKEELLNIKGIAIKKYEKYGEAVLKIVNEFRD